MFAQAQNHGEKTTVEQVQTLVISILTSLAGSGRNGVFACERPPRRPGFVFPNQERSDMIEDEKEGTQMQWFQQRKSERRKLLSGSTKFFLKEERTLDTSRSTTSGY